MRGVGLYCRRIENLKTIFLKALADAEEGPITDFTVCKKALFQHFFFSSIFLHLFQTLLVSNYSNKELIHSSYGTNSFWS